MTFETIKMNPKFRMVRIGFGQNYDRWFFRIDLWWVGFRIASRGFMGMGE